VRRFNGRPLPLVIDPPRKCVKIMLPDEENHRRAFWDSLNQLARWHTWQRDDAHTARAVSQVWTRVLLQALREFPDGCEAPEGETVYPTPYYETEGDQIFLRWHYPDGRPDSPRSPNLKGQAGEDGLDGGVGQDGFTPIVAMDGYDICITDQNGQICTNIRGELGIQGIQGIPGINGQDGQDAIPCECSIGGIKADPTPLEGRTYGNICNASQGLYDWLASRYDDILQEWAAYASLTSSSIELFTVFATLGTPFITDLVDAALGLVTGEIELLQAGMTTEFGEDAVCALYCLTKNQGGGITEQQWNDWLDGLPNNSPEGSDFTFAIMFKDVMKRQTDFQEAQLRFITYTADESNLCEALCVDCPTEPEADWEQYFDFTTSNGGFAAVNADGGARAYWVSGEGWTGVKNILDSNSAELRIHRPDLASDAVVIKIVAVHSVDQAASFDFNFHPSAGATLTAGDDQTTTINCEAPFVYSQLNCRIDIYRGNSQPTMKLKSLRLFGTGENPFA
jgi:hypothetical protein